MARLLVKDLVYDLGVYKRRLEASEREVARLTVRMSDAAMSLDLLSRENARLRNLAQSGGSEAMSAQQSRAQFKAEKYYSSHQILETHLL